jgi:F0F1-type ATP synthase membrane subunit b/b'
LAWNSSLYWSRFLGSVLEERKTTIVKGVQDAEDRFTEAQTRLSEAEKQSNQPCY